ncbi:MAG: hypothetical protein ACKOWM_03995 [Sphingomonadales bacterium]
MCGCTSETNQRLLTRFRQKIVG